MKQASLELGPSEGAGQETWLLALVGLVSLVQFKALALLAHPPLEWLATLTGLHLITWLITFRAPALLWCGGWRWWLARRDHDPAPKSPISWRTPILLSAATLAVSAAIMFGSSIWTQMVFSAADAVVLVVVAVLVEEWWFRGVVYDLAAARFPANPRLALLISAVLFSLGHWQYHGFRLTLPALAQMAYTLPLGLVFGGLRATTGRIWPGVLLHMALNGLAVLRAWTM